MHWKEQQLRIVFKMMKQIKLFQMTEDEYKLNGKMLIVQLEKILTAEDDYTDTDFYKNTASKTSPRIEGLDLSWRKEYCETTDEEFNENKVNFNVEEDD